MVGGEEIIKRQPTTPGPALRSNSLRLASSPSALPGSYPTFQLASPALGSSIYRKYPISPSLACRWTLVLFPHDTRLYSSVFFAHSRPIGLRCSFQPLTSPSTSATPAASDTSARYTKHHHRPTRADRRTRYRTTFGPQPIATTAATVPSIAASLQPPVTTTTPASRLWRRERLAHHNQSARWQSRQPD